MDVVAVLFDVLVNERIDRLAAALIAGLFVARGLLAADAEMFAPLAFDTRALDHVPEVRYDTHLGEELAGFVEVNAPGIAAALGENFEHMPDGVITPDASVHPLPLGLGRVRATDVGRAEHPVATVEPAVRSPGERVQDLVRVGAVVPSIQQDLWSAAGPRVVPIAD